MRAGLGPINLTLEACGADVAVGEGGLAGSRPGIYAEGPPRRMRRRSTRRHPPRGSGQTVNLPRLFTLAEKSSHLGRKERSPPNAPARLASSPPDCITSSASLSRRGITQIRTMICRFSASDSSRLPERCFIVSEVRKAPFAPQPDSGSEVRCPGCANQRSKYYRVISSLHLKEYGEQDHAVGSSAAHSERRASTRLPA